MHRTSRILLLFTICTPILSNTIKYTPKQTFTNLPRAVPEAPVEQPHLVLGDSAERPRNKQAEEPTRPEDVKNLIQFPERPSFIVDYGDDAGRTQAVQQLRSASEGGTKPVLLYGVRDNGDLYTKKPVELLKELENLEEVPGSNGMMFRLVQPTEIKVLQPPSWEPVGVEIGWNTFYYSPHEAVKEQLAQFDAVQQALNSQQDQRAGTWWARAAKRSNVVTTIIQSENLAGTNSTTEQDLVNEFQLYLDALYTIEANLSDLVVPVLDNITSQTNSTFIHSMAQSILYDITGSTKVLSGPFNFGMSYLDPLKNATSTLTGGLNNSAIPPKTNTTSAAAIFTAMENIYSAMWVEAMNAANSTGLLPRHALFLEYLSTNNTALYPPGFDTVAGGHINSTHTKN